MNTVLHNLVIICIIWSLYTQFCSSRVVIVKHLRFTVLFLCLRNCFSGGKKSSMLLKFQAIYADDIRKLLWISSWCCLANGEIPAGVVGPGQ